MSFVYGNHMIMHLLFKGLFATSLRRTAVQHRLAKMRLWLILLIGLACGYDSDALLAESGGRGRLQETRRQGSSVENTESEERIQTSEKRDHDTQGLEERGDASAESNEKAELQANGKRDMAAQGSKERGVISAETDNTKELQANGKRDLDAQDLEERDTAYLDDQNIDDEVENEDLSLGNLALEANEGGNLENLAANEFDHSDSVKGERDNINMDELGQLDELLQSIEDLDN
ncbi:uncharacterized protein LOC120539373 isoform X1 [Polypterus senegalus]|uniref:uncharacterized protein LOC120539373 isoform X1 n=1 Tax=Polypterus senegalus TaxID=55291 RepID=UPI001964F5ED|nr:uncharacterized protein LOC120539373 isoform X1 [Polypterus senegalus]